MNTTARRLLVAVFLGAMAATSVAAPAFAHVELVSSVPTADATLTAPPETIDLTFSTSAEPAGAGVVLLDSQGIEVEALVEQIAPEEIVVTPQRALQNGTYSVVWTMKAGDAHPKSGSVTFQVTAPGGGVGAIGATDAPAATDELLGSDSTETPTQATVEIREPNSAPGDWLSRFGRWGAMLGALIGIGAFSFAASSLVGTRREVQRAGFWVRRAGVLVIIGTIAEVLGMSMLTAGSVFGGLALSSLFEVLSGPFGIAILLRLAAGTLMVHGMAVRASEASTPVADPIALLRGADDPQSRTATLVRPDVMPTYRLDIHHSATALMGSILIVASYLFDGHTVTAAPAPIVRVANMAHVMAAGVWLGGVLLMGVTLTSRWRRSEALGAAPMALRFSRVASVAVAVVGLAGVALAWSILDSVSELVTTPWGRLLIVKVVAVGIAAGIGAYNHFNVVPALEANPNDEEMSHRLRRLVRVEGLTLLFVVAVTAVFVGVAS